MADTMNRDNLRELVRLNRYLGNQLSTGVPILQSLQVVAGEAVPPYDAAFQALREGIANWPERQQSTGEIMAGMPDLFPTGYRRIFRLGEVTGTLDEMCLLASDLLEPVALGVAADEKTLDEAINLLLFTRQFADLLAGGMSWPRCLMILGYEAIPPFNEVAKGLMTSPPGVRRWVPLSERMEQWPALFSPGYRAMARAGEPRGQRLEEAMKNLLILLEEDWRFSRRLGWPDGRMALMLGGERSLPSWEELDAPHQRLVLLLFCRAISLLTAADLPPAKALDTAAYLLPDRQRDQVQEIARAEPPKHYAGALQPLGFLPEFVIGMLRAGEIGNAVSFAMNRAADVYREDLRLEAKGE